MSQITDRDVLDALAGALRQGRRLSLPAAGLSMGPAFAAADSIVIEPVDSSGLSIGMIAVYERGDRWIAHRVVWVFRGANEYLCVTKGDGVNCLDRPFVRHDEYIGRVTAVQTGEDATDLTTTASRIAGLLKVVAGLAGMAVCGAIRGLSSRRQRGRQAGGGAR